MRPRLDCRGELLTSFRMQDLDAKLQCGHGSIAVENGIQYTTIGQDGQNFNAATARLPWRRQDSGPCGGRGSYFNAATARLPWRSQSVA